MTAKQRWFQKDNSAAVFFMMSAAIWLVLGVTMGLILALEFVFPDLFNGVAFLVFGRLRQAHTNTVMFAWLSPGMMGIWFYIVPRLAGRKLWSEPLGNFAALLWNIALAAGIVLLLGGSNSKPGIRRVSVVD